MAIFTKHHHHYTEKTVPYVREINVTEHKAPTDESIRLLNEFEEKARENIIKKIKVNDNSLNIVSVAYYEDQITRELRVHIKFSINGKEYLIKTIIDENKIFDVGSNLQKIIFETIAQDIMEKLISENETFINLLKSFKK